MKYGNVVKSAENNEVTTEELAKINLYARKTLSADEVYVFPVILCDTEIDRDNDKFTKKALEELAALYLGKTVICDHDAKNGNQRARIFDTEVIRAPEATTADGEELYRLKGKAYMLRTESAKEVIDNIEAGIYKEVSVNCRVDKITCSICGEDYFGKNCAHLKGCEYDGKTCFAYLDGASDAYELSFVAVPAQLGAGVVKWYDGEKSPENTKKGYDKMNCYEEAKKSLAALGIDLDSIAKSKGEMPSVGVILDEVSKKFREIETEKAFVSSEAVKSAAGREMTSDEVISALKAFDGLEEKAKLYDEMKSKAVDAAIASGIKAKGDSFDESRYRKLFESSDIEEINGWAADFEAEAKKSIAAGRTSEDSDRSINTLAYGNLDGYKV